MKKIRINELARELEVKSKEIIEALPEMGILEKLTHSSSLDDDLVYRIRKHFGFEVKNLPGVLAELKAKGVKMAFDMRDSPTTSFAFISDNAGNAIELIEHKTH